MISTWWLKSSSSTNRSHQRCKLISFRIPESSRSLKGHSTISLKSAREVSQMSWLLVCTAEFIRQANVLSATRVTSRKCTSSDRVLLKFSTTRTMKYPKRSQSYIFQNTRISVTIRFCTTWSQTLFSRLWPTRQRTIRKHCLNQCRISSSCVLVRMSWMIFVIFSHRLLRTSKEDHSREDTDSCNKRIQTLEDTT